MAMKIVRRGEKKMTKIPAISNEKLEELLRKMHPVVKDSRGLHYIQDVDPREIAFTWEPKKIGKADDLDSKPYKTVTTIHGYGYQGFFKPSLAEVLAQIPKEEHGRCVAFETNYRGFTEDSEHHVAETHLYQRKG